MCKIYCKIRMNLKLCCMLNLGVYNGTAYSSTHFLSGLIGSQPHFDVKSIQLLGYSFCPENCCTSLVH